jgi:hypothetical protein
LRVPATTSVITHSPSRSNRRGGFRGSGIATASAVCKATRGSSRKGWTSSRQNLASYCWEPDGPTFESFRVLHFTPEHSWGALPALLPSSTIKRPAGRFAAALIRDLRYCCWRTSWTASCDTRPQGTSNRPLRQRLSTPRAAGILRRSRRYYLPLPSSQRPWIQEVAELSMSPALRGLAEACFGSTDRGRRRSVDH